LVGCRASDLRRSRTARRVSAGGNRAVAKKKSRLGRPVAELKTA